MSVYVLSPDALQDLQDIWDFVALDNENSADQLEDEFFNAFEKLAWQPGMGHTRRDITVRDVRFWPTGSYLIVYRERPDAPQVLAVLHGSRDVPEVMRKREFKLTPQQQISGDKEKKHHRNHPVHSKERGVQLAEVVVADQSVLVSQERRNRDDSCHRQLT